ncbi:MAG: hypothetical protein GX591_05305 [Planctomycetes bacterium]|nr:hypothetical protein [Planctomycetota bacterium]
MTRQAAILIDHGTTAPSAEEGLARLTAVLAGRAGMRVYPAHLNGKPSLAAAVAQAAADGAERVIVLPCLLTVGHHLRDTLPALLEEARRAHPAVELRMADPLGLDDRLADILLDRLRGHLAGRTTA